MVYIFYLLLTSYYISKLFNLINVKQYKHKFKKNINYTNFMK